MARKHPAEDAAFRRDYRRDRRHPGWKNPFALFIPQGPRYSVDAVSLEDPEHGPFSPDPATAPY